jgi:hypothetical protein
MRNLHSRRLRRRRPRSPSLPILPRTPWKAWSCMNRESRALRERHRPVLRPTGCWHPPQNLSGTRYARAHQSLVGRTEQDPANQHQIAAAIALRSRPQQAVSPSLLPVWCNVSACDQLHSRAAVSYVPSGKWRSCQLPGACVPVISQARLTFVRTGSAASTSASAARSTPGPPSGRSPTVRCGITSANARRTARTPASVGHLAWPPCGEPSGLARTATASISLASSHRAHL